MMELLLINDSDLKIQIKFVGMIIDGSELHRINLCYNYAFKASLQMSKLARFACSLGEIIVD